MATVYLAIQESFEREVALKIMAASLSEDESFSERFIHEAKVVSRLIHPNIVTVHDVGIHNGHHYLSMEYVPGRELKNCMAELNGEEVLRVVREIASALDFSGQKGYVHRDVKPENIVLHEESGRAVLMDFGIAKADDVGAGLTQTGMALGTPYYMSPEQARGQKVDGRADLYSLGVVFYKMLMGVVPYDGDSAVAIGIKHISEPIPELPIRIAAFQNILNKLLAKDPAQRYQRGAELVADLKNFSGDLIDKSRKQYFKQGGKSKYTPASFAGGATDKTLLTGQLESDGEPTRARALWLLAIVLCTGLGGYYYFFGLAFPPSHNAQQAALKQLGLAAEKPAPLTLEGLLQVKDESTSAQEESVPDVSKTSINEESVSDVTTGDDAVLDDEQIVPNEVVVEPIPEIDELAVLVNQAEQLEQRLLEDSSVLSELIATYRDILSLQADHIQASQRLLAIEGDQLEDIEEALDGRPSTAEALAQVKTLLDDILINFPELEGGKRYQRMLNKFNLQEKIYQQLVMAAQLLEKGQLTKPKDENALAKYNAVLVMAPDNAKARAGINNIVENYHQRARQASQRADYQSVLVYTASGLGIQQGHTGLKQLQSSARQAVEQQKAVAELMLRAQQLQEQGDVFSGQPNAVQTLLEVQKKEPGNTEATTAINAIVDDLLVNVQRYLSDKKLKDAAALLGPALAVLPENKALQQAKDKLDSLQPSIQLLKLSGEPIADMSQELPSQFKAGRVLYIGFTYKNFIDATTVLQAILFDGEQTVQIAAVPVIVSGQSGDNYFKIQRPVEGFKAGGYRLEIVLAGQQIFSQSFVIAP